MFYGPTPAVPATVKWYHDPLAIGLLYLFLWPVSIFAAASHPLWSRRVKTWTIFMMFAVPAATWLAIGIAGRSFLVTYVQQLLKYGDVQNNAPQAPQGLIGSSP